MNPYVYGPIVSNNSFFGREDELHKLEAHIINAAEPASCSVVGETRIGKSSLLRKFVEQTSTKRPDLLILQYDVSRHFQAGTTVDFYRQFVGLIRSDLSNLEGLNHEAAFQAIAPETPWPQMVRSIENFFRSIKNSGKKLLIVMDEFDFMTEHFKFDQQGWKILRGLGYDDPTCRIYYLTASRRSIETLEKDAGIASNFHGIFEDPVRLSLMSKEDATDLLNKPASTNGCKWTSHQQDLIMELAGRHPYCTQMVCFYFYELWQSNNLHDMLTREQIMSDLRNGYKHLFDQFRLRLQKTNLFEILLKLANGAPLEANTRQIEELIDLGYIQALGKENDKYQPFSPMLDLYLKSFARQYDLWPMMEETETKLRKLIELKYQAKFGNLWIDEIRKKNPNRDAKENQPGILGMVERWETSKIKEIRNPFTPDISDMNTINFAYIGDLKQLIEQQWGLFQETFPFNKSEFSKHLESITFARNPMAHYRKISTVGKSKAEVACQEILNALEVIDG